MQHASPISGPTKAMVRLKIGKFCAEIFECMPLTHGQSCRSGEDNEALRLSPDIQRERQPDFRPISQIMELGEA
jgi:hypothetical protein